MEYAAKVQNLQTYPVASFERLTQGLSSSVRTRITTLLHKNTRKYLAGTDIIPEGDDAAPFFWLQDGWVALNKSLEDGHVQTIDIILPSDVIRSASGKGNISIYDVHALTDVTLSSVTLAELDNLEMIDPPHLWASIRNLSAAANARIAERMLRLGQGSAEMRIAYVLTELCLRINGGNMRQNTRFHLPLTQQQLGEYTGLSSVHVCRTFRRLSRADLIDTSDHLDIVIKDLDGLAHIAEVDLNMLKAEILPAAS